MIRKFALFAAIALAAVSANAQNYPSSFSIGPRISSFSTDIGGIADDTLKSGRTTGYGLVGNYRNGRVLLDFAWDHDSTSGLELTAVFVDVSDYRHERGEVTAGYALSPNLDIEAGFRDESFQVGGFQLIGNVFASEFDFDHQALTAGLHMHSDLQQPVSVYAKARGYLGSAKYDNALGLHVNTDTQGWRGEAGANIRLGESKWLIVPGFEYERFDTRNGDLNFNTNRFFLNVVFQTR